MRFKEFYKLFEENEHGNVRVVLKNKMALQRAAEAAVDDPAKAVDLYAEMINANGDNEVVTLKYNRQTKTFKWVKTH